MCSSLVVFFFFKQKTAYEMRISDWSSDVCSSDLPSDSLRLLADSLLIRQPADALRYGLVDGLKYKDELLTELKALTSSQDENELNTIKLSDYSHVSVKAESRQGLPDKIAVIYASGEIISGEGTDFITG